MLNKKIGKLNVYRVSSAAVPGVYRAVTYMGSHPKCGSTSLIDLPTMVIMMIIILVIMMIIIMVIMMIIIVVIMMMIIRYF